MSIPDCTLVTSCFDLSKYHKDSRIISECVNNMKPLLEVPCYLVIFCNKSCYELIKEIRSSYGLDRLTKYNVSEFEDIFCYRYLDQVKSNREKYWPTRDKRTCAENHLLCCNKFDFVLKTIESNPFNTKKFGWIDSNLRVNFEKICEAYTNNMLLNVLHNVSEKFHIQILNVNDKKYKLKENKKEFYQEYRWVVCGCLFICGKEIGIKILNRLNEIFEETTYQGYGHGEEMLYLEVLDEFYDDIERSYGDYQNILNNFIKPNKGYHYINELIIKRYLNFGYYKECYDCCKKLLNEIENYNVEINYSIYFSILFSYYVSCFYFNGIESYKIVNHIYKLCNINYKLNLEYIKNEAFFKSQFEFSNQFKKKSKVVFCIFGCATIEKYKNEILKINDTWGKRAEEKGLNILYFLGEELTNLVDEKYVYLPNVLNDYSSASYKQNLGLKYIYENYNPDFVFVCGTETYVNVDKLLTDLENFDKNKNLFIGGHGDYRMIGNDNTYFHSGAGFVLTNCALKNIYSDLYNLHEKWINICNLNSVNWLLPACDVELAYFLQQKNTEIIESKKYYSCNHKGLAYNNTFECCSKKIKIDEIICCHNITLHDFDEFTIILKEKNWFV